MRHNEFRYTFANLFRDVCHDVKIKFHLQLLQCKTFARKSSKTYDDARFDIKTNGLWQSRLIITYFDINVLKNIF